MDILIDLFDRFYDTYGYGIFIMIGLVGAAGILGQWSLYVKCGQPGVACIVPFWNVVVFLKIVGRPAWQSVFVVLPPMIAFGLFLWEATALETLLIGSLLMLGFVYYMVIVYIELCNCFGKHKLINYIVCLIFNGFYVLNLGLSNDAVYIGPVHAPKANIGFHGSIA